MGVALAGTRPFIAWLGALGPLWVGILLLFAGLTLHTAFKPGLNRPGLGSLWFLAINALMGLVLITMGFGQRDPDAALVTLGAAAVFPAVLLLINSLTVGIVFGRLSLAALIMAMSYLCTFWLPPTEPAALILHLKGVLIAPTRTTSVLRVPGDQDVRDRLARTAGALHLSGTVDPGTYRVGMDCSVAGDINDRVVWTAVDVSIGATVTVPNVCP